MTDTVENIPKLESNAGIKMSTDFEQLAVVSGEVHTIKVSDWVLENTLCPVIQIQS